MAATQNKFVFRSQDRVGYPDAEEDREFLSTCFVDSGQLAVLRQCDRAERVVLGRTGSGKSALLDHLISTEENVIRFDPISLSLNYVSNSTILQFLQGLGVNFDLFFNVLWKHVFAVELIKRRYDLVDERAQTAFMANVFNQFRPAQRRAIEYLQKYGNKFFIESDHRVIELTKHFEGELQGSLGFPNILQATLTANGKLSEDQKTEVRERAQNIVGAVHMRHLSEIIDLIDTVLADKQRKYFIVLDGLDGNWVDTRFKARLIRALLDAAKAFRSVTNLKIVVALRYDLIDRVLAETIGSGAQKEKYYGSFLDVTWTRPQLTQLLDRRITHLVQSRYSKSEIVTHRDLMPKSLSKNSKQATIDWILDRTLMRPRDLIAFVNACIRNSDGCPQLSASTIRAAEGEYSRARLDALCDEWELDFPCLRAASSILKNRSSHFSVCDVTDNDILLFFEEESGKNILAVDAQDCPIALSAKCFDGSLNGDDMRRTLFSIFYQVGLVGLKLDSAGKYEYCYAGERRISKVEITPHTRVAIQPTFFRVLGTEGKNELDPLLV